MNVIAAAALLTSLVALQGPAFAQADQRARLRLAVVDAANAPVPNATVTVYTIHGPRTVNADANGIAVIADLPADLTQVWARVHSALSGAEVSTLKPGPNEQTLTLRAPRAAGERFESGS